LSRQLVVDDPRVQSPLLVGVRNPDRLKAVQDAGLTGHLQDPDLDAVVATLQLACKVPIAVINIVTADLQTYAAEVGVGSPCTTVPDGISFCAQVVETGLATTVSDAATHPIYANNPLVQRGVIGSYAGAPLVDNGAVVGSLAIFDRSARTFSAADLEILRHQARLAASVLALRRSARTDPLTKLPNRLVFNDRLSHALGRLERNSGVVALTYLDIDGFKTINDRHGHDVGDKVLIELARRVGAELRSADTLVRLGGDEFVVVSEDLADSGAADQVSQRLVRVVREPWILEGQPIEVSVSFGSAVTDSAATSQFALLRDADMAMYSAKTVPGTSLARARETTAVSLPPQRDRPLA
jgi:diguanylate cyclase (GGDEF)-like protein